VIQYITQPFKQKETIELVRQVGRDFGETLASLGFPLIDSVETFMMHRNLLVKAATHLAKRRAVLNDRAVDAIPLVTHIMDEALVSLVAAHQGYRDTTGIGENEDNNK